jgi:hypothetical protein
MKSTILSIAALLLVVFTSCKKDRTCECNVTTTITPKSGSGISFTSTSTTKYTKASKKVSGVRDCVVSETTTTDQDGDKSVVKNDCKLK